MLSLVAHCFDVRTFVVAPVVVELCFVNRHVFFVVDHQPRRFNVADELGGSSIWQKVRPVSHSALIFT